mmetsp:Transcript_1278/g.3271  ORF Transcript_1278/g.3271 Transcript_1278/m.3271 type:complete len:230 (-) Transcript_1278:242-931(-)
MSAPDSIAKAYEATAAGLKACAVDCRFSGSTAILCVMRHTAQGRQLTTGWVGDSRAVLGRSRGEKQGLRNAASVMAVPLTRDHKPTDPKERARLQEIRATVRPSRVQHPATGAFVEVGCVRVWDASQIYGVAMSRSLGDAQVHPFIIPVPDITSRTLDERDRLLVLATDGVWDVMENQEAVVAANAANPQVAAANMVREAAGRWDKQMPGRRDDVTSVVIDLMHPDLLA